MGLIKYVQKLRDSKKTLSQEYEMDNGNLDFGHLEQANYQRDILNRIKSYLRLQSNRVLYIDNAL